jgi:deoxycytidylate deaminase
MEHCDTIGHMMEDNHCVRTIHAEVNAIAQAARNGVAIDGASMYVNVLPCWNCFKQIVNAGIKEIYFGEMYGAIKPEMVQACENNTIKLEQIIIGQSGGAIWKGTHWGP